MITIINEPYVSYEVNEWRINSSAIFHFNESICHMDDNSIYICPPNYIARNLFSEKPKNRLSMLRGKLAKQNEEEIDSQISELRNEWNRNI